MCESQNLITDDVEAHYSCRFQSLCGEDHIVKGVSVHISNAAPKTDPHRAMGGPGGMGPGGVGGPPGQSGYGAGQRGGPGGHRDKGGHSSFGQPGPYGQPTGAGAMGMAGGSGWNPGAAAGGRASMEMPNIQALGLSSNQGGGSQGSNPMAGMGLNMLAGPMNPALVAAALNQAAWGMIGNPGGAGGGHAGSGAPDAGAAHFPTPTSFSTPGNVTTTQVGPQAGGNAAAAGGILAGWGAAGAGAGAESVIPAATPPAVTPQHHPTGAGSWPSQTRKDHGATGAWKGYGGDV